MLNSLITFSFFFFGGFGIWIQGFMLTKQICTKQVSLPLESQLQSLITLSTHSLLTHCSSHNNLATLLKWLCHGSPVQWSNHASTGLFLLIWIDLFRADDWNGHSLDSVLSWLLESHALLPFWVLPSTVSFPVSFSLCSWKIGNL
jgi:hypothetical protein